MGERSPGVRGREICYSSAHNHSLFTQAHTSGAQIRRRPLDSLRLPTLNSVEHALLFFALGSEARDFLAGDDGFVGSGVDDTGEDGAAVAATNWSVSVAIREEDGKGVV